MDSVFINYSFDKEHVPKIYEELSTPIKKKDIDYPRIIFRYYLNRQFVKLAHWKKVFYIISHERNANFNYREKKETSRLDLLPEKIDSVSKC